MTRKHQPIAKVIPPRDDLTGFACPNEDCCDFNRFAAGNLSVCERMGKDHRIRRLYCRSCGHRFSERQGSLMAKSKLPEETVVRIVKCLGYGCSVEATADICEVDSRTVGTVARQGGSACRRLPSPATGAACGTDSRLSRSTNCTLRWPVRKRGRTR